LVRD